MTREEKWKQDEAAIEQLVRAHDGVVKTAELYTLGIDYRRIQQFVDWGVLERIKSGYYTLREHELTDDRPIVRGRWCADYGERVI